MDVDIYLADWFWNVKGKCFHAKDVITPRIKFHYRSMLQMEYGKRRAIRLANISKVDRDKYLKDGIPDPVEIRVKEDKYAGPSFIMLDQFKLMKEKVYISTCDVWNELIVREMQKQYMIELIEWIQKQRATTEIYPEAKNTFQAFKLTSFRMVRAVIIGQDPYHTPGAADGLSFSTKKVSRPPSLKNIYQEIHSDLYSREPFEEMFNKNDLDHWANQGVLMLNRVLTVSKGEADSHKGKGWEKFTEEVIRKLNETPKPIVFMLWGKKAQELKPLIDQRHLILEAAHPSPFSADNGFFGCKHFSQANVFLNETYVSKKIVWANYKGIQDYTHQINS
jgi:uracil-DNA glycosylase